MPGSLLYLAAQAASALLFSPVALLCVVLPSVPRARVIGIWARFNIWTLRVFCGITCEVRGLENIPPRPAVLLANHQSALGDAVFSTGVSAAVVYFESAVAVDSVFSAGAWRRTARSPSTAQKKSARWSSC